MKKPQDILMKVESISSHFLPSNSFPKPYIGNNIKAILLGADPGTDYKIENEFEFVFGLNLKTKTSAYFFQFEENLKEIDLTIDNLYIQNLIQNYFTLTTSKHTADWKKCAVEWIPYLKNELDQFDPMKKIPVLTSAYIILEVLCLKKILKPEDYYTNCKFIAEIDNKLERPLIPFFRGGRHKYDLFKWEKYSTTIKQFIQNKA